MNDHDPTDPIHPFVKAVSLLPTGICSAHRTQGPLECETCWPREGHLCTNGWQWRWYSRVVCSMCPPAQQQPTDPAHPHLVGGEFQSDKYPTTPLGCVPLKPSDKTAQDLLWEYAQRRRAVDAQFADDLEIALRNKGYKP